MATFRDILNNVRQILADPNDGVNTVRWQNDELLRYLNRAYRRLGKRADLFRRTDLVAYYSSRGIFTLPPDVLNVLDVFYDGRPLTYTDRFSLREEDPDYMTRTGAPTHWFRGISNPNEVRLYPQPEAGSGFDLARIVWETSTCGVPAYIEIDGDPWDPSGDAGALACLQIPEGTYVSLAASAAQAVGTVADVIVNGLIECTVSYLPDWVGTGALDTIIPDREDIEETLEYGILMHAYAKAGHEMNTKESMRYRGLFEMMVEEHKEDRMSDFTEQDTTVPGEYI
ncbi:MAG: hypothetical protein FJ109_14175 [Deltaproteobacteria bacterium]|nr:hypothetical protein [Deltaproteobacteria bacterium]